MKLIRHHYIPQFILRNFSSDRRHLWYFDKITEQVSRRSIQETFMVENLYYDEINAEDYMKIEKDL
ncbi:MAG: DUF4238 domain-containing protein, partial [Clostridia bacterium]|nr:DUF4238 domain-containing protein [Clostridia bacterium]